MSCMIMLLSSINNMAPKSNFNIIFNCMTFLQQKNKWNSFKGVFLIVNDDSSVSFKGTVTRFCACAATWFLFGEQFFKIGVLLKKSSSIDPETPEKAIISVFKSYLVHLGSFKRYILYFCASIVEKIRNNWEDDHTKPCSLLSVFIQTDQMWPLMWSSGFHFCLLMYSSQRSTFDGYFLNDKFVKRVKKGFLDTAVDR